MQIKKIAIIGPESTGKSTLGSLLAKHYNTLYCQEYAREYLQKNGTAYKVEDLLEIAKGQLAIEDLAIQKLLEKNTFNINTSYLFIDTDLYVIKVWSEYVFNACNTFILEKIVERKYDLYLLCNTDLPWVKDDLREYPTEQPRKELFNMYKDILINQNTPWTIISGNYLDRFNSSIHFIDSTLNPIY